MFELFVNPLRQFWQWWIGELADMAPDAVRRLFAPKQPVVTLELDGDRLTVGRRGHGPKAAPIQVDLSGLDRSRRRAAALKAISRVRRGTSSPAILIPESSTVQKQIRLPLAVAENLHEAMGYDMDRQTPFKADEVYYDCKIVSTDRDSSLITADLTVVPRSIVDNVAAEVRQWGLKPASIGFARVWSDPSKDFCFITHSNSRPGSRFGSYMVALLAITAVALGAALVYVPLERLKAQANALADTVERMKLEAREASGLDKEIQKALERRQFGLTKKRERLPAVVVMNHLTKLLPDDTWLFQLQITGPKGQIQGYSPDASKLVGLIERSSMFAKAELRSRLTRDARLNAQRFHIAFDVLVGE